MNLDHIKAILATEYLASKGLIIDGKLVATNGHIAVVVPDDFELEDRAFDRLEATWRKGIGAATTKAEVADLRLGSDTWIRKIGPCFVNERFVRAFGPECEWHASAFDKPLVVRLNGDIVGLVMPMRAQIMEPCSVEPTDEQLFAPIAGERNGFYLISDSEIKKRIASEQKELDEIEDRIGELEEQADELRNAITALEAKLRKVPA
jgi:hypothetical protein